MSSTETETVEIQQQKLEEKRNKNLDKLVKESFNQTKFDKMDYAEAQIYANHLEDLNVIYNTKTKAMIIEELAIKLEKQDYPIFEIREKIIEGYEGRVTSIYVSRCLPDRFKRPARVEAGKKNVELRQANKNRKQTLENTAPELQDQIEEMTTEAYKKSLGEAREILPDIKPSIGYSDEYVQSLKNTIYKLNGEIPYADIKCTYRVNKLSKQKALELDTASKKAKKEVYLITDTRTQEIIGVYADKDKGKYNISNINPVLPVSEKIKKADIKKKKQ